MPYTLAKFFLWGLLMALGGGLIGWFLRSLRSRAEVATARAATVDIREVERLRRRLANLEPAVAERNRLRMELADVRGHSAGAVGFASTDEARIVPANAPAVEAAVEPPTIDLEVGAAVLGRRIELDDLTVVEGIGPKISLLCNSIGVATWRELAGTEVGDLQAMLDAAGSRFQMHKPETWPRQAGLLADGHWTEFKQLTDELGRR